MFQVAGDTFKDAHKLVHENPAQAIVSANSGLESVCKHILESLKIKYTKKDTLAKLTETVLKEFKFPPLKNCRKI